MILLEKFHKSGNSRFKHREENNYKIHKPDEVKFDDKLFEFYKSLMEIRKNNPFLALGDIEYLIVDDEREILAYSRFDKNEEVIVVFNTGNYKQEIDILIKVNKTYKDVLNQDIVESVDSDITIVLKSASAAILK